MSEMKTFTAQTDSRYYWTRPYCGEYCEDNYEDPSDSDTVECEHCGKEAKCEYTVE